MPKVDVCFPVAGRVVPLDHGYPLYAAVARCLPRVHGARWFALQPLPGRRMDGNRLELPRRPELRMRVPVAHIGSLLPLVGRTLDLAGFPLMVGAPTIRALEPSSSLDARLVVIKITGLVRRFSSELGRNVIDGKVLEARFLAEARRQLAKIGVEGAINLTGRRRLRIRDREVVGFSVRVSSLSETHSIRLQEEGIGGKRAMGCGLFRPTRAPHD